MSVGIVDLFCGVGGLTHGLIQSGFNVVAGIDCDSSCEFAYTVNNGSVFVDKDVEIVTGEEINSLLNDFDVKILVGCAPCQPFSTHSNKITDEVKKQNSKWNLLNHYLRIVRETKPHILSMENVPNLSNKQIFEDFVSALRDMNYYVSHKNIYCPDYGIPQKRRRLVLLASRYGEISLIAPTHEKKEYRTVKNVIGTLPQVASGEVSTSDTLHFTTRLSEKNLKRIQASKPNGTWADWPDDLLLECHKKDSGKTYKSVYGRMAWNEPSPTITTQFFNIGTGRFGHPEQDRAITVREAAILQTFPTNYQFCKKDDKVSMNRIGMHIGNAVPVHLGYIIGMSIQRHLRRYVHE
jgi:DNA (cytosine-5)-methyltransferase 1